MVELEIGLSSGEMSIIFVFNELHSSHSHTRMHVSRMNPSVNDQAGQ